MSHAVLEYREPARSRIDQRKQVFSSAGPRTKANWTRPRSGRASRCSAVAWTATRLIVTAISSVVRLDMRRAYATTRSRSLQARSRTTTPSIWDRERTPTDKVMPTATAKQSVPIATIFKNAEVETRPEVGITPSPAYAVAPRRLD